MGTIQGRQKTTKKKAILELQTHSMMGDPDPCQMIGILQGRPYAMPNKRLINPE
jgi:hypothetical protein